MTRNGRIDHLNAIRHDVALKLTVDSNASSGEDRDEGTDHDHA